MHGKYLFSSFLNCQCWMQMLPEHVTPNISLAPCLHWEACNECNPASNNHWLNPLRHHISDPFLNSLRKIPLVYEEHTFYVFQGLLYNFIWWHYILYCEKSCLLLIFFTLQILSYCLLFMKIQIFFLNLLSSCMKDNPCLCIFSLPMSGSLVILLYLFLS